MSSYGKVPIHEEENENLPFEVEKILDSDNTEIVRSVLYFRPPQSKIVTGGDCGKIRVYCSRTFHCQKVFRRHKKRVNDLIKMKDKLFLSCSDDGYVLSYVRGFSWKTGRPHIRFCQEKVFHLRKCVLRLLKLSEDLFVCQCSESEIIIMSCSSGQKVKRYYLGRISIRTTLLLSKEHPYSFYTATQDENETIKLVDYSRDLVTSEFKKHMPKMSCFESECVLSMALFCRSNEILIVCDTSRNIFFYNTTLPQFTKNQPIKDIQYDDEELAKEYKHPPDKIFCCFCFRDEYLATGDNSGLISFFRILDNSCSSAALDLEEIKTKWVHYDCLYNIKCFPNEDDGTECGIVCCSGKIVFVLKISKIHSASYDSMDRKERVEYCMELITSDEKMFKIVFPSCSVGSFSTTLVAPKGFL